MVQPLSSAASTTGRAVPGDGPLRRIALGEKPTQVTTRGAKTRRAAHAPRIAEHDRSVFKRVAAALSEDKLHDVLERLVLQRRASERYLDGVATFLRLYGLESNRMLLPELQASLDDLAAALKRLFQFTGNNFMPVVVGGEVVSTSNPT